MLPVANHGTFANESLDALCLWGCSTLGGVTVVIDPLMGRSCESTFGHGWCSYMVIDLSLNSNELNTPLYHHIEDLDFTVDSTQCLLSFSDASTNHLAVVNIDIFGIDITIVWSKRIDWWFVHHDLTYQSLDVIQEIKYEIGSLGIVCFACAYSC